MSKEMRCSNSLSLGVKRAFFCKQCSKEMVILCEDCATFCHPLHEVAEINLVKDQSLMCDCGNARSINEICLVNSNKPDFNTRNYYVFTHVVPKFSLEYYGRRCELLSKSGNFYIVRATDLAAKSCFLACMEDINTAIAWDCEKVESKILEIDVGSFVELISNVTSNFLQSIQNMDLTIMRSVEVVMRFCKRVRSTCNQAKQKAENPDGLNLLIESLQHAEHGIMEEFWRRASSFGEIHLSSIVQFDLYKRHVMPNRNQKARLLLELKHLHTDEIPKFLKEVRRTDFEYDILN